VRIRYLLMIASCVLPVVVARPAGAQGATVSPTVENISPELKGLTGTSIADATNSPDSPYTPYPVSTTSSEGSEEANTRLTNGELVSEIVLSGDESRSVASVTARVCPNESGQVSARIKMNIGAANGDQRSIEATAHGRANDAAELKETRVTGVTGKGAEAAVLRKLGLAILRQAEAGWRKGLCVKVDVAEGGSQTVTPKSSVAINATAKPRSGGGEIKGPITSKKIAGEKRITPAKAASPAAKFVYTAPDKTPGTGSVTLTSVSRRGIGTANLEYTTEGNDLRAEGGNEIWSYSGTKCDGPVGDWTINGTGVAETAGSTETITFTLAEGSLSGTWNSTGTLVTPVGGSPINMSGAATYTASSDGRSGTLNLDPDQLTVAVGTFCKDGNPVGG
jgi:hypothetical protein